jgi:polysaccharide biosynthesis transport protein
MNLLRLSLILKARARTVVLVTLLTLVGAAIVAVVAPKTYKATTSLILNYKGSDPVMGSGTPAQASSGYFSTYVATQIDIIKSPALGQRVVRQLGLTSDPGYRARYASAVKPAQGADGLALWIAEKLLAKIDVKPSHDSSVLTIMFSAPDARFAAAVANAFADEYRKMVIELDAKPAMMASDYLYKQLTDARRAMEASLADMANFQQETGIISSESTSDVETTRLSELSTQLVAVQSSLMEANSKSTQVMHGEAAEAPDIANNPLIQSLKSDLSKARMKWSSVTEIVTPEHPHAVAAKAEVDSIDKELARQTSLLSAALMANTSILSKREAELTDAFAQQKNRVLDLNQKRTTLTLLAKEVENRKRVYDALSQRLAQTSIQGQSHQSDVAVLTAASVPALPSNPRKLVVAALAGMAGALLGVCAAFLQEFLDRRVRSIDDLLSITRTSIMVELGPVNSSTLVEAEPLALLPNSHS